MDFQQRYAQLAAQLGDNAYKVELLRIEREDILGKIKALDELAGLAAKGAAEKQAAEASKQSAKEVADVQQTQDSPISLDNARSSGAV
jgi:septal ring factor EnvC (AmiA/AmiB activator)